MKLDTKGILAPYTLITSVITGAGFPLLGSLVAMNLGVITKFYIEGIILVMLGGFIAHYILTHTVHDYFHLKLEKRSTLSKKTLLVLMVTSAVCLLAIAIYLTFQRGWPVFAFSLIGGVLCIYAEGLLHHESQMAFAAIFLVLGGFYVQAGTLELSSQIWISVLFISLFAFFSQYGWIIFYRLDDYKYDKHLKNRSILLTKLGIIFLILYFLVQSVTF